MRYYVGNFFYGEDLLHYRTAGSKNGVRRYQNPDGSLTPEGRIHYNRPLPKKKRGRSIVEKLFGKKSSKNSPQKKDRRKISDMSDEEIKSKTARKKIENEYLAEVKKGKELRKKKSNEFGKKLAETALAAGKDMLTSYFKYALDQASANAEAERKQKAEDRKNAREDAKAKREDSKGNDQEKEDRYYKYDKEKQDGVTGQNKEEKADRKQSKIVSYVNRGNRVVDMYSNNALPVDKKDFDGNKNSTAAGNSRKYEPFNGEKQEPTDYESDWRRNRRG